MRDEKRHRDTGKNHADAPDQVHGFARVSAGGALLGVFATHAPELAAHGLAVVPVDKEKTPRISRFNNWSKPPQPATINDWLRRFANDNIGIVTGPASNITVVDVDNVEDRAAAIERFGNPPFEVRTSRGMHLYYRYNGEKCQRLDDLAVDIKGAGGYVVGPHSIHKDGSVYEIVRGSLADLETLPTILDGAIQPTKRELGKRRTFDGGVREGERNDALFDFCMRQAHHVDHLDALLDIAQTENATYDPPMGDAEVTRVTNSAWRYTVAGMNAYGGEPCCMIPLSMIRAMVTDGLRGQRALCLAALLQAQHGFRQGDPFFLASTGSAGGMAGLFGWSHHQFRSTRDHLENHNVMVCVVRGEQRKRHIPKYRLNPRWDWTFARDDEPEN